MKKYGHELPQYQLSGVRVCLYIYIYVTKVIIIIVIIIVYKM